MWVRFTRPFDFDPPERGGRVTIAFAAGAIRFVRRCCGKAALAAGAAVPVGRPAR